MRADAPSNLDTIAAAVDTSFFLDNSFRIDSVNTKTFILMLANNTPLSFVSGRRRSRLPKVLRESNRNEFHHLHPRNCLKEQEYDGSHGNAIANFTFLSKADNILLGGDCPSIYRRKMPADPVFSEILKSALCPASLFKDDFEPFVNERAELLTDAAKKLLE